MIISIDAEIAFNKNPISVMTKALHQLGIKGNLLNATKTSQQMLPVYLLMNN